MKKLISTFIIISSLFTSIYAQSASDESEEKEKSKPNKVQLQDYSNLFPLSPVTDTLIITSGTLLLGTDLYLDKIKKYNHINPEDYNFDKNRINSLDRLLMQKYSKPLDITADITVACSALTPAILCSTEKKEWLKLATLYGETLLIAESIKDFGKIMVNRARPYMYYDNFPEKDVNEGDWCKSFPSGHTTIAFTAATFASYAYCSYFPDSDYRIAVIATSYSLATATGILRMLSGNHFYSDVLTGAILGTVTGFTVPYLHQKYGYKTKTRKDKQLSFYFTPNSLSFTLFL